MRQVDPATVVNMLADLPLIDMPEEAKYLHLHIYRYIEILRQIPQLPDRATVLDVGIASGQLATLLKRIHGFQVSGIDYDDGWMRTRLSREGIEFKTCDLTKELIPFTDESFDLVLFCEVLEHLPIYPYRMLGEIRRVIKKNGGLILTTPNIASLINRFRLLLGRNPLGPIDIGQAQGHIREYTASEIRFILEKTGFKIDKLYLSDCWEKTYGYSNPLHLAYRVLIKCIPSIRGCIVAFARK